MTIKKTAIALAAAASLALPTISAVADAATMHATPCRPVSPGFVYSLGVSGHATCGTARTVERYWESHQILGGTVRIAGTRWTMLRFAQTSSQTATQFTAGTPRAGAPTILIESRPYGGS